MHKRQSEENARIGHLNRAMDVQILREQPWNVVTNAARLEGLDGGTRPASSGGRSDGERQLGWKGQTQSRLRGSE